MPEVGTVLYRQYQIGVHAARCVRDYRNYARTYYGSVTLP